MKINLNQSEIYKALIEYINNQGIDISGKQVDVTLTAGRKGNGHTAHIEITPKNEETTLEEDGEADLELAAIKFDFEEK